MDESRRDNYQRLDRNDSEKGDGQTASDNMGAGVIAEFHRRLAAVEQSQAALHTKVDDGIKSGHLDPDLSAKVKHVMDKFFPHDAPGVEPVAAQVPRFDPFTGLPLN